jgi:hypothetical protein
VIIYGIGTNHDIALLNITTSKAIAGQGYSVAINVMIANPGDFSETVNITALVNATIIRTAEVTLMFGGCADVAFTWDTTGFAYGDYIVSAFAEPVPGETHTSDNNLTDSAVHVGIPGDVDANGIVNMLDLYHIALHFGSSRGQPSYVANYDIDDNGIINMLDLYIAATHYGQTDP